MKSIAALRSLVSTVAILTTAAVAHAAESPYVLRDTTGLPLPTAGQARLVVARERILQGNLKPEFVFVDGAPLGMLPPQSAITGEIGPGRHRVWLGRGGTAEMWFEAVPGGRYLVRMREDIVQDAWRADLVRESRDGYLEFAQKKNMKLAVTTPSGIETLQRDLKRRKTDAKKDSTARAQAEAAAQLPIVIAEAWYVDLANQRQTPSGYDNHPGTLTVNSQSLRYARADTTVLEIPRSSITLLRYGGMRGSRPSPWLNVYYTTVDGTERGASFVDPAQGKGSASYNRLFDELESTIGE